MSNYVVELTYDQDESYRLAVRPAHRAHLAALHAEGVLRMAGPMASMEGGMMVLDLPDRAAVDTTLARDPYFTGEQQAASVSSVREWLALDLEGMNSPDGADSPDGRAPAATSPAGGGDLQDLLDSLARHRGFLRQTLDGLTDAQAGERPTVSALCLGGLIKHVAATEKSWIDFAVGREPEPGPEIDGDADEAGNVDADTRAALAARSAEFSMLPEDSIERVLASYAQVAAETERTLRGLDLDSTQELPEAPWQPPGVRWTARRVVLHVIAETAQHAGHADIIRETIDGTRTMG